MSTPLLPRVAIIGAGPSGFYAAEALQKAHPGIAIDLYDRLPTPFGLVRGGVAPDHPKIKSVTKVFERIASQPGFRFLGHVEVGSDVTVAELREHYDAVIATFGARTDRPLGIPGNTSPARTPRPSSWAGTTAIRITPTCRSTSPSRPPP